MKTVAAWVLLVLIGWLTVEGATAQPTQTDDPKYWIFFKDRGGKAEQRMRYPIAPEAMERRARKGAAFSAAADFRVSPEYLTMLRDLGITPVIESRWLNAVSAHLHAAQREAVMLLPFVSRIRPVGRSAPARTASVDEVTESMMLPLGSSSLEYGPSEVQLALVNAIPPLDAGFNGSGVRLGFLDTPYLGLLHASLQHLHSEERVIIEDFTGLEQSDDHGQSVISVAAGFDPGQLIGPAHGAFILAAATEYVPTETNAEEDYFVAGLEWLESMGADVVSASVGYFTFDAGQRDYTQNDLDGDTAVTTRAADQAAAMGVTMVSAAGNEACSSPESCWYYVITPADGDSVIAVGGVTRDSTRSWFSSFGPTADGRIKPDVAALGTSVYNAAPGGGYRFANGTSFAAPMVSAIVAQMLQANPALEPMEVRDILRNTASRAENPNNAIGWGIVNADAAVKVAIALGVDEDIDPERPTVQAYPNPATDYLFIHINARSLNRPRLYLHDVLGRRVDSGSVDVQHASGELISLSTSSLPSGVYVYTILTDSARANGSFVIVR